MEKKKIVTSLTLAGILTAGVLGGNSNAANNSLGVCKNILSGENLVPYVLSSKDDVVTSDRIKAEFTTASNLRLKYTNKVATGDKFTTSTGEKTVIVYGDANQDGIVDTLDVNLAQRMYLGEAESSTKYQKAAADVRRSKNTTAPEVDTLDIRNIQKFYLEGGEYVDEKPEGVKDEVIETEYSVKVVNNAGEEQNYINNVNATQLKLVFRSEEEFSTAKTLKYEIKDTKSGDTIVSETTLNNGLPAHSHETVAQNPNLATNPKVFNITSGAITSPKAESITIILKDSTGKIIATKTIENKYAEPKAAKVTAVRVNAKIGAITFEGYNDEKITELEYTAQGLTKTIPVTGNKLTKDTGVLDVEFGSGNAVENISYKLVDEYGNKSTTATTIKLPVDGAREETKVTSVVADLTTTPGKLTFTITGTIPSAGATAILYNENTIVAEKTISTNTGTFDTEIVKEGNYKVGIIVNGNGLTGDSATKNSEEVVSNAVSVKELSQVTDITFNTSNDGTKAEITWTDSNNSNLLDGTPYTLVWEKYIPTTGQYIVDPDVSGTLVGNKYTVTLGSSTGNLPYDTIYRVKVTAKAKSSAKLEYIDSKEAISNGTFYINTANLLANGNEYSETTNSVIFNINEPVKINNVDATYKVEIYELDKDVNGIQFAPKDPTRTVDTSIVVKKDANGRDVRTMEVPGLASDTRYVLRVLATVDGITGKTSLQKYTGNTIATNTPMTYKVAPTINNLRFVKEDTANGITDEKAETGTLFMYTTGVNANKFIVNGDKANIINPAQTTRYSSNPSDYANGNANNYTKEFNNVLKVAKTLTSGDIITVENNKVNLKLVDKSNAGAIQITADANDLEIYIEGDGTGAHDRSMTITNTSTAKITVGGNGLVLEVKGENNLNERIHLENGAEIVNKASSAKNYYVVNKSDTPVKINGVDVKTTGADVNITAKGKELTVDTPAGDLKTDLTFTNQISKRYTTANATINLKGKDNTSKVIGTITINSKKASDSTATGSVTVKADTTSSDKLNTTEVELNINVTDADVDVKGFEEAKSAKVNVNVTADRKADGTATKATASSITVKPEKDIPTELTSGTTIELKDYTDEEWNAEATLRSITNADRKTVVKEFINSFGINGKGAKLTVNADGSVTITFSSIQNINETITGLKVYKKD